MDTTRALKYVDLVWKMLGLYPVAKYNVRQVVHLVIVAFVTNFCSCTVFTTKLFFITDTKGLLRNLPIYLVLIISAVRFYIIFLMRLRFLNVNEHIKRLDQRPMTPSQIISLTKMTKFGQILTLIVTILYMSVNITAAINALLSHRTKLMFEIWLPFDWTASARSYYLSFAFQNYTQFILCLQTVSNDTGPVIYLIILTAHFRILMERFENLKKDPAKSEDESVQELFEYIEDHRTIMAAFNSLQRTISHTTFIQFITTALVLALNSIQFLAYTPSVTEVMNILFLSVGLILQILMGCYYANKFMATTDQLVSSLYSMEWYNQSQKFKKTLIIFMSLTQKKQVILAGRIIPVNLATFVSIMKASYSLITVAQQLVHRN